MKRGVQAVGKAIFFVAAAPLIAVTALRMARLERQLPFDALVARLRARRAAPLLPFLLRPTWLAGSVERLLPWLPPRDMGVCLRRALIVLELWSRCGLEPRLHLGLSPASGPGPAHAWITADIPEGGQLRVSGPLGNLETFVF